MTISEYISQLKDLLAEHGDLEMVDEEGNTLAYPEFNDDGEPAVVCCDRR